MNMLRTRIFVALLTIAGFMCQMHIVATMDTTTVATSKSHDICDSYFMCPANTHPSCIPWEYVCDGEHDCECTEPPCLDETDCIMDDKSDAGRKPADTSRAIGKRICAAIEFVNTLYSIEVERRLSNQTCDGAEEFRCKTVPTESHLHVLHSMRCIPKRWKCDGENDCHDGSDEMNCTSKLLGCSLVAYLIIPLADFSCNAMQFECERPKPAATNATTVSPPVPPRMCIPCECVRVSTTSLSFTAVSWQCDGEKDCVDGKDEHNCPTVLPVLRGMNGRLGIKHTCSKEQFKCVPVLSNSYNVHQLFSCTNGHCIFNQWKCDGDNDCGDNSDEIEPACETHHKCDTATQFQVRCIQNGGGQ
jgi:hypothetical protein